MTVVSIADEIFRELDQPEDCSIPSITFWLSSNIGKLNALLGTEIISSGNTFSMELGDDEKVVFKKLYEIYYYQRQLRKNLGAAAYVSVMEIREGNRLVRRTNRTEIAKVYAQTLKDLNVDLEDLVVGYKINRSTPVDYFVPNPTTAEDFMPAGSVPPFYPRQFSSLDYTRAV